MEKIIGQKKRYENIDFMKGICILLVVATHLDLPVLSHASFSLFRMPLYYFLSGIFFSRYDGFRTFLIKKTNNLIIPYLFFSLFTLVAILVFYFWKDFLFFFFKVFCHILHVFWNIKALCAEFQACSTFCAVAGFSMNL